MRSEYCLIRRHDEHFTNADCASITAAVAAAAAGISFLVHYTVFYCLRVARLKEAERGRVRRIRIICGLSLVFFGDEVEVERGVRGALMGRNIPSV